MIQIQNSTKPDTIGAATSALCAIHCIATPFLFLAKAGSSAMHVETPVWYQSLDYLFVVVSFMAVYFATKNSAKRWVRNAMWTVWVIMFAAIANEILEVQHLPEAAVYVPALVIAGLHLYNRKHCKCEDDNCCVETA